MAINELKGRTKILSVFDSTGDRSNVSLGGIL